MEEINNFKDNIQEISLEDKTDSDTSQKEGENDFKEENLDRTEKIEEATTETNISEETVDKSNNEIFDKICELQQLFEKRIAYDEHKNALFDKVYDDKKRYEEDIIASVTTPIILDIITVIEELNAQISKLPDEASESNYNNLLKRFKTIPQRLEDVLYENNVEPYEVSGDLINRKMQNVVRAEETDDESLRGKIKERLTCGYQKDNKIIKKERIVAYKVSQETEGGNK